MIRKARTRPRKVNESIHKERHLSKHRTSITNTYTPSTFARSWIPFPPILQIRRPDQDCQIHSCPPSIRRFQFPSYASRDPSPARLPRARSQTPSVPFHALRPDRHLSKYQAKAIMHNHENSNACLRERSSSSSGHPFDSKGQNPAPEALSLIWGL